MASERSKCRLGGTVAPVLVAAVLASPCFRPPAQAEKEIVIEVESAGGVATYFEKIGFDDLDNHPERLQAVPPTRIFRIPMTAKKVWRENVSLRKSVFFRLALSGVLQVNEKILVQRGRLLGLSLNKISVADAAWLSTMMAQYGVAKGDVPPTAKLLSELIWRI